MKKKSIKFDLSMNGTRVTSLNDLRQNATPELLRFFLDGRLKEFLVSRDCFAELAKLKAIEEEEVRLVKAIYDVLGIEKAVTLEEIAEGFVRAEPPEISAPEPEHASTPSAATERQRAPDAQKNHLAEERETPKEAGSSGFDRGPRYDKPEEDSGTSKSPGLGFNRGPRY